MMEKKKQNIDIHLASLMLIKVLYDKGLINKETFLSIMRNHELTN